MSDQETTPTQDEVADAIETDETSGSSSQETTEAAQQTPTAEGSAEDAADTTADEDAKTADAADEDSVVIKLKAEADKNLAGWQRTLAEFQNYKRRVEREHDEVQQRLALDVIAKVLPILDDFERAMASVPEEHGDSPWVNGVSLISGKFKKLFEDHDITPLDPVGEEFDPNVHQAIGREDSDEYESGTVMETLQKGYMSGDILVRPAIVRVAN